MKKQIIPILLMIVAILIVCAGLFVKKQNSETSAGNSGTKVLVEADGDTDNASEKQPQMTEVPHSESTPTAPPKDNVAPKATPASGADTTLTAKPTPAPTAAPTAIPQSTAIPQTTANPSEPPATEYLTKPDSESGRQEQDDTNTAVTDAYPSDTVNMLTSLGLSAEDINTLADMGVTEEEIQSVTSAVEITPEMVAELHNYKDIWKNASQLERKLMIEMLKQLAGQ